MAITKIKTLFEDKEKTQAVMPRTKISAVSEDGTDKGLDAILADATYCSNTNPEIVPDTIDADTLGGKLPSYYYPIRKNLLDNWYFINPVNQRGNTLWSGQTKSTYGLDRWIITTNDQGKLELTDLGLKVTSPATEKINISLIQLIELERFIFGQTYTVSTVIDNQLHSGQFIFDKRPQPQFIACGDGYIAIDLSNGYLRISINFRGITDGIVSAAKVELGNTQTLAHQENSEWALNEIPDYGEELRKCQRYQISGKLYGAVTYRNGTVGIGFFFPTPVTMRANIKSLSIDDFTLSKNPPPKIKFFDSKLENNGLYVYFALGGEDGSQIFQAILKEGSVFDSNL